MPSSSLADIAQSVEDWLLEQEQRCDEEMLFLYGYLVPMVTLVAADCSDDFSKKDFCSALIRYAQAAAEEDKLEARDLELLQSILDNLIAAD